MDDDLCDEIISPNFPASRVAVIPITSAVQLFRTADARKRSKLARLIVGRFVGYRSFIASRLKDEDERVRANAVESLWRIDAPMVRTLLQSATSDPHPRVCMNALLGLYLVGEPGIAAQLIQKAADPSAAFRAAVAWVMGETRSAEFSGTLATLSKDRDDSVRKMALASIPKIAPAEPEQTAAVE
jgi:HEAT repeat protein